MKLLDLYRAILKTAHLEADEEGYISLVRAGQKEPFIVKEKRLALPTPEQLKQDGSATTLFHPLFEYLTRGESPVMVEFRRAVAERLHFSFLAFASELLSIAASQQIHAQLTPEQSEFLAFVPEADEQMTETFGRLVNAMPLGQNQKVFCSIYIKKGGVLLGKSRHRVAVVTFPLYEQLVKDGEVRDVEMAARKGRSKKEKEADKALPPVPNETYGVKLRAVDREAFIKLFEYMVPGIGEAETYSAASNSNIAPNLDALMQAVQNLAGPLNDLVTRFEDRLGEAAIELLHVEDSWVPEFVNLAALQVEIRKIPMQAGNEGGTAGARPATAADPHLVEAEAQSVNATGSPQATEEEEAPAGFRLPPKRPQPPLYPASQVTHQQPAIPQHAPPYQPPPYQQPFIPHQQPYQPPPQQHAPLVNTGQGVDFQTLLRTMPGLAQVVSQQMPVQQQQQQDLPGWAATPGMGTQTVQGYAQPYNPNDRYRSKF